MVETDVESEALARLEAALDRIAQGGSLGIPPMPRGGEAIAAQRAAAARLDALIAQLRGALETGHAAQTQGEGED